MVLEHLKRRGFQQVFETLETEVCRRTEGVKIPEVSHASVAKAIGNQAVQLAKKNRKRSRANRAKSVLEVLAGHVFLQGKESGNMLCSGSVNSASGASELRPSAASEAPGCAKASGWGMATGTTSANGASEQPTTMHADVQQLTMEDLDNLPSASTDVETVTAFASEVGVPATMPESDSLRFDKELENFMDTIVGSDEA